MSFRIFFSKCYYDGIMGFKILLFLLDAVFVFSATFSLSVLVQSFVKFKVVSYLVLMPL